jgi:hypothetical protein
MTGVLLDLPFAWFPKIEYRIRLQEDRTMTQEHRNPSSPTPPFVQGVLADGSAATGDPPHFSLRKTGHDLRNALNVIRNASYLLRRKLVAAGGANVDLVDMIEESVQSAEAIATAIMDHAVRSGETSTSGVAPGSK